MDMDVLLSFTQQVQTVRAYSMLVTLQGTRRTEKAEKTCLRKRQVYGKDRLSPKELQILKSAIKAKYKML